MKMKKKAAAKSASKDLGVSPFPLEASPCSCDSPKPFDFNLSSFRTSSKKKTKVATSALIHSTRLPTQKTLTEISDLKDLASSRSDSIKRHLDLYHSEILKEIETSQSTLSKKFKIQTQACQQLMHEAKNEYKKMYDRISDSLEAMKASYAEFFTDEWATASHERKHKHRTESNKRVKQDSACKTSIPELKQSLEKAIEALRSGFEITST